MERRSPFATFLVHCAAFLLGVFILAPLVWLFVMSISSTQDLTAKPLHWWPRATDFSRYRTLVTIAANSTGQAFLASLRNSLTVATLGTIGGVLVAVPAGWAVSRNVKIGWSLYAVIATYMLPPVALAVPLYRGLSAAGLLNTVYGLALVYLTILAPFTTWLLKSGFDSIPQEIEHAAMIDGARLDQIIRLIMLPLAAPVVVSTPEQNCIVFRSKNASIMPTRMASSMGFSRGRQAWVGSSDDGLALLRRERRLL